jgi:hypothetical protein
LKPSLQQAEGLYIRLKQYDQIKPGLPASIAAIIFPNKNDDQDSNFDTTSIKSRTNDELNIQLKTPSRNSTKLHSINGNRTVAISRTETVHKY